MNPFVFILGILLLSSCETSFYYQMCKITPVGNANSDKNGIAFEDNNCTITYNFFGNGGDASFIYFNKTDSNIYINKEESFFVLNGYAYNLYQNGSITSTTGSSVSNNKLLSGFYSSSFLNSQQTNPLNKNTGEYLYPSSTNTSYSSNSTTFLDDKIICVPAKTKRIIAGYKIHKIYIEIVIC